MEASTVDEVAMLPSTARARRLERRLEGLVAELARHYRVKGSRGKLDLEDRALHARVEQITREP